MSSCLEQRPTPPLGVQGHSMWEHHRCRIVADRIPISEGRGGEHECWPPSVSQIIHAQSDAQCKEELGTSFLLPLLQPALSHQTSYSLMLIWVEPDARLAQASLSKTTNLKDTSILFKANHPCQGQIPQLPVAASSTAQCCQPVLNVLLGVPRGPAEQRSKPPGLASRGGCKAPTR